MTLNIDRFEQYFAEGRLLRRTWTSKDEQGRAMACALAALSDEVARSHSPSSCPAADLPAWMARLVPWMDDSGTAEAWPQFMQRLGKTLRVQRSVDQWHRAEYAVRALCVREAMSHTAREAVLAACERVAQLCESVASGHARDGEAFSEARATAWAAWAAEAEARAAWEAAAERSAERAAASAERAAASATSAATAWEAAAAEAAERAAESASASASASAWEAAAAWAAARAAWEAAADRLIDGALRVLEAHEVAP